MSEALASGELVAPFKGVAQSARAYFAKVARNAAARPEVVDFVAWLKGEAKKDSRAARGAAKR